jgi:hypothetical protein
MISSVHASSPATITPCRIVPHPPVANCKPDPMFSGLSWIMQAPAPPASPTRTSAPPQTAKRRAVAFYLMLSYATVRNFLAISEARANQLRLLASLIASRKTVRSAWPLSL